MFSNQVAAKDIVRNKISVDIVSAVEQIIESIDNHAITKDITLAFDTNIEECFMQTEEDLIHKKIKNVLYDYIEKTQYGNQLSITLFASELIPKLNINEDIIYLQI